MHDDLALYVLGALEDPREFEAHLETCDQCRAELAELRGTLDVLDAGIVRDPRHRSTCGPRRSPPSVTTATDEARQP